AGHPGGRRPLDRERLHLRGRCQRPGLLRARAPVGRERSGAVIGASAILTSTMLNRLFRREKLDQGVEKSRTGFFGRIRTLLTAERPIDDDLWDELEELLIQADVGVQLTDELMERLRAEHRAGEIQHSRDLFDALKDALATSLEDVAEKQ